MREGRGRNKGGGEREKGKEGEKKEEEETEEETERGQGEKKGERKGKEGEEGKEGGREEGKEVGRESHKTITIQSHNRSYLCALDHGVLRKPSSRMHRDTPCLLSCKWQCRHPQGWGLCWHQVWRGSLRDGGYQNHQCLGLQNSSGCWLTGRKLASVSLLKSFPTPFPP